ncbi:MAG: AAA family ATPase, partial [Steroidobacteraceae bacterium]
NPREFEGTYPLPESQLDRFMLRVDLDYPGREHELKILERYGNSDAHATSQPDTEGASTSLAAAQAAVEQVHVAPELSGYVVDLAAASREHAHVGLGLSTRGVLALLRTARIAAGMRGGDFVTPDDVKRAAPLVIPHRIVLAPEAMLEGTTAQAVTQQLLDQTPVPR